MIRCHRRSYRLAVLLVVGLLLVVAAGYYRRWFLSLPTGRGPVAIAVDRAPFAGAWTERRVLLLGIGDSITEGYGASPGLGYFDRLAANPTGDFADVEGCSLRAVLPNLVAENRARSCTVSHDHLKDAAALPVQPPEVFGLVVMTSGGNDLIHDYGRSPPTPRGMFGATWEQAVPWIAGYEERLGAICDLLRSRFPGGCQVFVGDIYDPTDGVGDIERAGLPPWPDGLRILAAYNAAIHRVAAARDWLAVVPIHDAFLGHGIHCRQWWREEYRREDPNYWYFDNLEDPNDRGYDALRRLFLTAIAARRHAIR
jgi:lysophospholipase L1-like esterase